MFLSNWIDIAFIPFSNNENDDRPGKVTEHLEILSSLLTASSHSFLISYY